MRVRHILFLVAAVILAITFACTEEGTETPVNENHQPSLPWNPTPPHLSTGQSISPFFSWSCSDLDDDPLTYTLELYQSIDTIFTSESLTDTFLYYTETLDENTEYTWKVTAFDGRDDNRAREPWQFTTGTTTNNPPLPPYNLNPHGNGHQLDVTIAWECVDPDGDPLTYDVWFSEHGSPLALIADDISSNSHAVSGLSYFTMYRYQIEAFDPNGGSAISHVSDFVTMASDVPDPPFDPVPADDSTGVSIDVTLGWSGSHPDSRPMTYDVNFGPAGGSPPVVSSGQTATEFTPPTLEYSTEYEWRITAEDDRANRTEGPLWSFTTEAEPQVRGVYAQLIFGRNQYYSDFDDILVRNDWISARFDSAFAPDGPITPLMASSVLFGTPTGYDVPWIPGMSMHFYNDLVAGYFLTPGTDYTYYIKEGSGVPTLEETIFYPACAAYITSPPGFSYVSRSAGFELQWADYCGGTIALTILDLGAIDSTGIYIVTDDDGSYTFTSKDLAVLDPMVYQIQVVLITENRRLINSPGYDPRSFISGRTLATQLLYIDP